MSDEFIVNGLPLPPLLISLMQEGRWKHPGEAKLREVIPFLRDALRFEEPETMHFESDSKNWTESLMFERIHEARGSKTPYPLELPWLDVEKRVFIAISKEIGADIAIALDYRTRMDDPRVIANEWQDEGSIWREVAPTFTEFVERLGL